MNIILSVSLNEKAKHAKNTRMSEMKVNFVKKNVQRKKSNLKTSAGLRLRSFDLTIEYFTEQQAKSKT